MSWYSPCGHYRTERSSGRGAPDSPHVPTNEPGLRPQFRRVLPSSAQRKTRAGLAVRVAGATRPDFMVWGGEGYRLLCHWRAARAPTPRAKRVSVEGSGTADTLTSSITKAPEVLCSYSKRRVLVVLVAVKSNTCST
jgi:hypothetical protein